MGIPPSSGGGPSARRGPPSPAVTWISSSDLRMLDSADLVGLLAACNLDAARLHRFRQFALELDLQEAIVETGALHLHKIREVEAAFERPPGDAMVEVVALVLAGIALTSDDQGVLIQGDGDLLGPEACNSQRDPVGVLTGTHDIAR